VLRKIESPASSNLAAEIALQKTLKQLLGANQIPSENKRKLVDFPAMDICAKVLTQVKHYWLLQCIVGM